MTTQFRIELPDDQARRLSALATLRATTPEALLAGLAQGLMADAAALEAWIAEGESDHAADRVVPFADAMSEMDAIIDAARRSRS